MQGELLAYAAEEQRRFDAATSPAERKERGHFGTPTAIARFMAERLGRLRTGSLRVLDPGAGVGTLSAAFCVRLLKESVPRQVHVEAWENDPALAEPLRRTLRRCRQRLKVAGHTLTFSIETGDFILENARRSLLGAARAPFDYAILNPPYFKLAKDSPQSRAMEHVVHGQPNIYALFLAAAADMLAKGGELVAITPRSYFSGPYFRRFRRWFFDRVTIRGIHVFESRKDAFKDDAVLQENVILHGERSGAAASVRISTSTGRDMAEVGEEQVAYELVVDDGGGDRVIRLTTSRAEQELVALIDALPCRLRELGLEISTGPVVSFRATEHLRHERGRDTAPLLWMHNVRPFGVVFPENARKAGHIADSAAARRLLVPAKTYLLFKRFTAKEQARRLVAGIFGAENSYSEWVGLENHLNYVHRPWGELAAAESLGLAAYFNSSLVDRYFRAVSGSTQVNAAEIRALPMPSREQLLAVGEEVREQGVAGAERAVTRVLMLPTALVCPAWGKSR